MVKKLKVLRPRSCALKDFQKNLSDINKYLSYYIFISSQFLEQNSVIIKDSPEERTTRIFSDNKLSEQFDVKLSKLEDHTNDTNRFVFDSVFLYCCFEQDNYFKEAYKTIQKVEEFFHKIEKVPDHFPDKIIELVSFESLKQIMQNLNIIIDLQFTEMDNLTFEYFRLRRNTIAHRNISERYKGTMKIFIETNGEKLNDYWRKSSTVVTNLDFSSKDLQFKNKDEVVDVINILRDTSPKLDEKIIYRITDEEWVQYFFYSFRKDVKSYDFNFEEKFIKSFGKYTTIKQNRIFVKSVIDKIVFKKR